MLYAVFLYAWMSYWIYIVTEHTVQNTVSHNAVLLKWASIYDVTIMPGAIYSIKLTNCQDLRNCMQYAISFYFWGDNWNVFIVA